MPPQPRHKADIEAAGFVFEEVEEGLEASLPLAFVRSHLQGIARRAGGEASGDQRNSKGGGLRGSP